MTAVADRHLLFGLLALQNGLINQAQLVAAFQAWTLDKVRTHGRPSWSTRATCIAARADLVEALVIVHLETHGGDPEQSLAAIRAGRSTRESLARIGDPRLEATLGHVGSGSTEPTTAMPTAPPATPSARPPRRPAVPRPAAPRPGRPGRRLRGARRRAEPRGGAQADPRPPRRRPASAASGSCSRPRSPAGWSTRGSSRSTAWAPTATAGRTTPCGSSGATASRRPSSTSTPTRRRRRDPGRRSLELRKLLRRFIDVCNAIDYAHSRGVLHRDIKPGNIIVGKHGETLVVDWGLAKADGPGRARRAGRADADAQLGQRQRRDAARASALGTPAYMSPEQAAGDLERWARGDVYSLGATLYCLLTGRPPFEGETSATCSARSSGATSRRRRAARPGDRPGAGGGLPEGDGACGPRTAMRSCRALAEDIERWMADEPVSAWREPLSASGAAVGAAAPDGGHRRGGGAAGRADRPGRRGGRAVAEPTPPWRRRTSSSPTPTPPPRGR